MTNIQKQTYPLIHIFVVGRYAVIGVQAAGGRNHSLRGEPRPVRVIRYAATM